MLSVFWFISYWYSWIYSSCILHKNWIKFLKNQIASFRNLKSHYFTCYHSFSFVLPLPVIRYHLLSLLSIFVIRCHSFSLVVSCCHALSLDAQLVCLFINDTLKSGFCFEKVAMKVFQDFEFCSVFIITHFCGKRSLHKICKDTGQWKPVFSHILCSEYIKSSTIKARFFI